MKSTKRGFLMSIAALLIVIFSIGIAGVPSAINYQGYLTDSGGSPINTSVSLTFTIYDAAFAGNSKWTETQNPVGVSNGYFNVLLGSTTPILDTVFNNSTRYLGIQVGADPEISPRTQILSVGYAMQSAQSDTADYAISSGVGGGWSDNGTTINLTTDTDILSVGPTTPTTPSLKFDLRGHGGASSPLLRFYFNTTMPADLLYSAMEVYSPAYSYTPFKVLGGGAIIQSSSSSKFGKDGVITNIIGAQDGSVNYITSGNLGIGTTTPSAQLHVVNPDYGTGGFMGNDSIGVYGYSATHYAAFFDGNGYFRDSVGIGVVNPTEKFEVAGTIHSTTGGYKFPDGSVQTTASGVGPDIPTNPFHGTSLLSSDDQQKVNQWIGKPYQEWTLCYKMTIDGNSSSAFHNQCDNRGPTVTVILANGRLLGGYADASWNDNIGGYIACQESFIFSLTANKVYPLAGGFGSTAILATGSLGPVFGSSSSPDIYVDLNNVQVKSYAPYYYSSNGAFGSPSSTTTNELLGAGVGSIVGIVEVEVYILDRPY